MTDVAGEPIRRATSSDVDAVVAVLAGAFDRDPVWSWAFPHDERRREHFTHLFGLIVHSAFELGEVWVGAGVEVAALWFPPGSSELTEADEAALPDLLDKLVGSAHAQLVLAAWDRFDAHRPSTEHWYLDFLGTDPAHAGRGLGMGLLEAMLARFDEAGTPAYLESTNPANNQRYARLGFQPRESFEVADGGPVATTMWRDAAAVRRP
jgi:GNAT superfamily N-acetyltransferase